MKKIQTNTIYQCSFCDFQDASAKVVGKHEWDCRHNTLVAPKEKIRREQRQELYQSETIHELNNKMLAYITTYHPEIRRKWSDGAIRFEITKRFTHEYVLNCSYPGSIQERIGIKCNISDYPILKKKLEDIESLNKQNDAQRTAYSDAREKAIETNIYASKEYVEYQNERNELMLQKKHIEQKINILAEAHQKRIDDFTDNFKTEFGYINFSDEIKQLKQELGIK